VSGDPANPADAGFPFPAATLLFDERTADYLRQAGRFPAGTLTITGSARLDETAAAVRATAPTEIARVRREAGARDDQRLLLFAAKEREARRWLPFFVEAVRDMPAVHVAIKPHPAETPDVYLGVVAGTPNVRVLDASSALARLLAAADAVVTVNSTVAVDALTLGVPSVTIGHPNNLTPFVDAGLMAGGNTAEEIRAAITQVLYDQVFRSRIEQHRAPAAPGQAAQRSAEAIARLMD